MNNNNNNNRTAVLLSLFAGQKNTITTPRALIDITGCHILGLILNQCIFWSPKSMYGDGWFYKTYEDWFDEIHVPERTLRRKLDKLEQMGFIKTKVRKVYGINTKHILPNIDIIVDAILDIENNNPPNRPKWPNGASVDQNVKNKANNTCTKTAPTGQSGRFEPAKVAVSIYKETEDHLQKNTTTTENTSSESSSSNISPKNPKPQNSKQKQMLKLKCNDDKRTDDEFLAHCEHHLQNNSDKKYSLYQRQKGLINILKALCDANEHFYSNGYKSPVDKEKQRLEEIARLKAQDKQHEHRMTEYTKDIKTKKSTPKRTGLANCSQLLKTLKR